MKYFNEIAKLLSVWPHNFLEICADWSKKRTWPKLFLMGSKMGAFKFPGGAATKFNPLLLKVAKSGLSQWFLNLLSNQAKHANLACLAWFDRRLKNH